MVSPNDYSIFGKAEAIKFVEDRDKASKEDKIERPFLSPQSLPPRGTLAVADNVC